MSLCKLPDVGYSYLSVTTGYWEFVWSNGATYQDNAQFWLDKELNNRKYEPAKWWKFWKPVTTFKVFACGGSVDPFYQTIYLQEK